MAADGVMGLKTGLEAVEVRWMRHVRAVARALVLCLLLCAAPASASPAPDGPEPGLSIAGRPPAVKELAGRMRSRPLAQRVLFGSWVAGMVADPSLLAERERQVGRRFDIASYFYGYGDWFPTDRDRMLSGEGARAILISWDMGPYRFTDWASGAHDKYLRIIGGLAARHPYPIYVRPWAEMNGDWQPYQPTRAGDRPHGGTPQEFVAAWRHVVSTVRQAGGTNIRWVFNPYAATYGETTPVPAIWPGRAYVDVLGMDGYNWGGGPAPWQSFSTIFSGMYRILTGLDRTLPVWVCEVGSREPSVNDGAPPLGRRSKSRWVSDMFAQTGFPRLKAIVWFDERKERDWRIHSSPGSLTAFRRALAG